MKEGDTLTHTENTRHGEPDNIGRCSDRQGLMEVTGEGHGGTLDLIESEQTSIKDKRTDRYNVYADRQTNRQCNERQIGLHRWRNIDKDAHRWIDE